MIDIFRKRNNSDKLNIIINQLNKIRSNNEVLAIAPDNTGYSWLGIKNGAIALFPDNIICLPQYYSNSIFKDNEIELICKTIADLGFKKIVFRGFPQYFKNLIVKLKTFNNTLEIYLLYGGFFSEFAYNNDAKKNFLLSIEMAQKGVIKKIGFNKNGMAETVSKLYGVNATQYYNKTKVEISNLPKQHNTRPKIGVLGNDDFRKNIINQVAAALMIEDSIVFVKEIDSLAYLDITNIRLNSFSKVMGHNEFVALLHAMHLNMYVSFSESWGHVIMESMAGGIPCLASNTSSIFEHNEFLNRHLVVDKLDDSNSIYKKALAVFENYERISQECCNHILVINTLADELLSEFLS